MSGLLELRGLGFLQGCSLKSESSIRNKLQAGFNCFFFKLCLGLEAWRTKRRNAIFRVHVGAPYALKLLHVTLNLAGHSLGSC